MWSRQWDSALPEVLHTYLQFPKRQWKWNLLAYLQSVAKQGSLEYIQNPIITFTHFTFVSLPRFNSRGAQAETSAPNKAHRFPTVTFLFREIEAGNITAIPPSYCTFLIRIIRTQQCMVGPVVFEGHFSNLKFKGNTTLWRGHCRMPGIPLICQNQHCPSHQLNGFRTFWPPLSPWISGPKPLKHTAKIPVFLHSCLKA